MRSMISKTARLTAAQVREIRELDGKATQTELANRFKVSQTSISNIQNRKVYRKVA